MSRSDHSRRPRNILARESRQIDKEQEALNRRRRESQQFSIAQQIEEHTDIEEPLAKWERELLEAYDEGCSGIAVYEDDFPLPIVDDSVDNSYYGDYEEDLDFLTEFPEPKDVLEQYEEVEPETAWLPTMTVPQLFHDLGGAVIIFRHNSEDPRWRTKCETMRVWEIAKAIGLTSKSTITLLISVFHEHVSSPQSTVVGPVARDIINAYHGVQENLASLDHPVTVGEYLGIALDPAKPAKSTNVSDAGLARLRTLLSA